MRYSHLTSCGRPGPALAWLAQACARRAQLPPLVAVAHGSTDPRAAAAITDLIAVVRARACRAGLDGLRVRAAYLAHALPSVPDVLKALSESQAELAANAASLLPPRQGSRLPGPVRGERSAVVLPLLLTGAYHSDIDLPAVLREAARCLPGLRISYGDPLGPHPRLLAGLDRRLAEAGIATHAQDTAVVLAAAGSSRPAANAAVARAAAAWQSARGWHAVVPAFASAAAPAPGQAVGDLLRAGAPRVAVATYLLAPGRFADQVRDTALAAGAETVSAPLGAAPEVADVIIERYLQVIGAAERPAAHLA